MKKGPHICRHLLCLLLLGLTFTASANKSREYSKVVEQSFPLDKGGEVNLKSMHGRIDVTTWHKDEVKIVVNIYVDAKNERRGKETLQRIDVDFSSSNAYVRAETEIETQKSMLWFIQDWLGEADIRIDYEVHMPEEADLDIEHRYGKIDIQKIDGDASIDLRHGDLEVDEVSGEMRLNLTHGDGVVAKVNESEVKLSYYKLRLSDANVVDVDASFSRLNISSANELRARSGNTKYFLGDIGKVDVENRYGTIEIDQLESGVIEASRCDVDVDDLATRLEIDLVSCDLHIERIDPQLQLLDIEGENAGLSLDLGNVPMLQLVIDAELTSVEIPDDLTIVDESEHQESYDLEAYRGSRNKGAKIDIVSDHGGVKIK